MRSIISSPLFILFMVSSYLGTIKCLYTFMQKRQAYSLKIPLQLYNIFQVIFNSYIVYGLYQYFPVNNIYGLNTPYNDKIAYYVYLHYISKYIDYLDTIFMILRKKNNQLSFLHVYHHATVAPCWGCLVFIGHGNGTAAFGCLVNALIHTIMYAHYFYTSFGFKNPFKQIITQAQIAQFLICQGHSVAAVLYEESVPSYFAVIQFLYHVSMVYLFRKFYISIY
jgi:hypothetical protein